MEGIISIGAYPPITLKDSGLYFSKAPFEGLNYSVSTERTLCFKINWASHYSFSKFTSFALFSKYKPLEGIYLERRLNAGFFVTCLEGFYFIHGGAYFQNSTIFRCCKFA